MSFPADKLHVITAISNPRRYQSRYALYKTFEQYVIDSGATLYTVEAAFGEREFAVTSSTNPQHIQLRNNFEVWQKEAMLNVALKRIPKDAQYIAWVDADVRFERPDWPSETIEKLQHHSIVQMFTHAIDLGPNYEVIQYHNGFGWSFQNGIKRVQGYGGHWHPGFAWASRRAPLDEVGGLIDTAVLGAGDHHMALGIIGAVQDSFAGGVTAGYKRPIELWAQRAQAAYQQNLGYVHGALSHSWHGGKAERQYESRWKILVDEKFDPEIHMVKDIQGLWQLVGGANNYRLRDRLMKYFATRNEDGNYAAPFFSR